MGDSITNYRQQIQCKRNWCWAAMTASLIRYGYRDSPDKPGATITQADIAERVLGRSACCTTPTNCGQILNCSAGGPIRSWCDGPEECNIPAPEDDVLLGFLSTQYGIQYRCTKSGGMPPGEISAHLSKGWPLYIVRTDGDGGGHVLAVVGIDGNTLSILDSEGDCKTATFQALQAPPMVRVSGPGSSIRLYSWTRTYYHV